MSAWPRSSWTYFGLTPCLKRSVAHVCLRSWKRISGSPARRSAALKARLRLPPNSGVPTVEGNNKATQLRTVPADRPPICTVPGCTRPTEDSYFPGCREHRASFDAKAKEEAWDLALGILGPWVEATRLIGSSELTRVMEAALEEGEREYRLALDEHEATEARLEVLDREEKNVH